MSNNTIFNVPEPTGVEQVKLQTTAATAQVEAPTSSIARQVEAIADETQSVARNAASTAQAKGPTATGETPSAINQFQNEASWKTKNAVAEGQYDVEAAKATGAGYVEHAKSLASDAISTAQAYLPTSLGGNANQPGSTSVNGNDIMSSLQSGATAALGTTNEYLASAQETAQPHIEKAKEVAQNWIGTAQGSTPASSTGIPATSASLESGPHTVDTPYPPTSEGKHIGK